MFQVAARSYALPLERVVEVLRMVAVTPVPEAPAGVLGAVNLRGTLIPMLDLRPRLGMAPTVPDPGQVFLVLRARGRMLGLLADVVEDIVQVSVTPTTSGMVILDPDSLFDGAALGSWGQWVQSTGDDARAAGDELAGSGVRA